MQASKSLLKIEKGLANGPPIHAAPGIAWEGRARAVGQWRSSCTGHSPRRMNFRTETMHSGSRSGRYHLHPGSYMCSTIPMLSTWADNRARQCMIFPEVPGMKCTPDTDRWTV